MAKPVHLIMPMAGRGARFAGAGHLLPKPLIDLFGQPFFVWATRAITTQLPDCAMTFVILDEHQQQFGLADAIAAHFPRAAVTSIPDVTAGALETALLGLENAAPDAAIIINDCDHYFSYGRLPAAVASLDKAQGFLSHFPSQSPNFSFARYGDDGALLETAEKRVISPRAIAGIYGFASAAILRQASEAYRLNCPYDELYVSGVYNEMLAQGARIEGFDLDFHVPFGTPAELTAALTRPDLFEPAS